MPHVIIEYSSNVCPSEQFSAITKSAHDVMVKSGLFSAADIKTRSYVTDDFLVGEKGQQGSFVHVTIYLLEGRTMLQKQTLSEALHNALRMRLLGVDQISVDIRELEKDTYRKSTCSLEDI
jgi:5-carboxymethyl-2-hydroxymuconate isomerase